MQVTNIQAVTYYNAVASLKDKKLPISVLFALKNNFNLFLNQIKAYEESRTKLIEMINNKEERDEEMLKLYNESVEHEVKTIKKSDIEKIDDIDTYDALTLSELEAINFIITE